MMLSSRNRGDRPKLIEYMLSGMYSRCEHLLFMCVSLRGTVCRNLPTHYPSMKFLFPATKCGRVMMRSSHLHFLLQAQTSGANVVERSLSVAFVDKVRRLLRSLRTMKPLSQRLRRRQEARVAPMSTSVHSRHRCLSMPS